MNIRSIDLVCWVGAAIGAAMGWFFGGLDALITAILLLSLIDFISGVLAAAIRGEGLQSKIGFRGIAKKIMMYLLIAAAHVIDGVLGTAAVVRDGAIMFFIVNETISLFENAGKLGIKVPPIFANTIESLKQKTDSEEDKK